MSREKGPILCGDAETEPPDCDSISDMLRHDQHRVEGLQSYNYLPSPPQLVDCLVALPQASQLCVDGTPGPSHQSLIHSFVFTVTLLQSFSVLHVVIPSFASIKHEQSLLRPTTETHPQSLLDPLRAYHCLPPFVTL